MTDADAINPHKREGFRRVVNACWYSLEGLGSALKHESAFRQELILALILVPLAMFLPVGMIGTLLLITSVFLVLIVELMNSAVEWVVDYISLEKHPYAKRAKDMASGAVFLSLLHAGITWFIVVSGHWDAVVTKLQALLG